MWFKPKCRTYLRCKKQDTIHEHPKKERTVQECRDYFMCVDGCYFCTMCEKVEGE